MERGYRLLTKGHPVFASKIVARAQLQPHPRAQFTPQRRPQRPKATSPGLRSMRPALFTTARSEPCASTFLRSLPFVAICFFVDLHSTSFSFLLVTWIGGFGWFSSYPLERGSNHQSKPDCWLGPNKKIGASKQTGWTTRFTPLTPD